MTDKTTTPTLEVPQFAEEARDQFVAVLKQGQEMSLVAAKTWAKAVSGLPAIAGAPSAPGLEAVTAFVLDFATEVFNTQREFAIALTEALTPTKSAQS